MTTRSVDDRGLSGSAQALPAALAAALMIALTGVLAVALATAFVRPAGAAGPQPVKIAVFDFELDDRSAGGGIVAPDATDSEYLRRAAEQARRLLADAGGYTLIDAAGAADDVRAAGGIRHCNGCEAALAGSLGADRSLGGIVTRVTRTEYTLQILVRDARTGDILANAFTGLRMGANYSWPRGVESLMEKTILVAPRER